MKNKILLLNLLKATRIKRTLPILTLILLPAAYANKFPLTLLIFGFVIILIYSAASIFNAYKDRDYKLPNYFPVVIISMIIIALFLSITNFIILLSALAFIFLGYIYHTKARIIPLGDGFIAGFTHYAIPLLVSSLLVGLNPQFAFQLSSAGYFIGFLFGPITNLKDIKKDRRLGYKTLVNQVKNPLWISVISLFLIFCFFILIYNLLNINNFYLYLIPLIALNLVIMFKIYDNKPKKALNIMRFYIILSFIVAVLVLTKNSAIISVSLFILSIYLFNLLK